MTSVFSIPKVPRFAGVVTGVVVLTLSVAAPVGASAAGSLHATGLRADGLTDPLGIDDQRPTLSWHLTSAQRDEAQSAYEIRAAPPNRP